MSKTTSSLELGFLRINRRKNLPLATQIYDALSQAILEGQLGRGFRLPSTRGLAADLGVSRTTVINAFDQLTAEGYLTGTVGKGTFVSEQLPEEHQMVEFQTSAPLTESRQNRSPRARSLKSISVSQPIEKPPMLGTYGEALRSDRIPLPEPFEPMSPFLPGVPALDEFPIEVWSRLVRRRWKSVTTNDISYGSSAGFSPLRNAVAKYVRAFRGVKCDESQVFVVAGTQQAIDLVTRLVISPGDKVLFEDPGYRKGRMAIEAAGARIIPVAVDRFGLDVDQAMAKSTDAKLVYVTPSHQFPMGVTMSIERRMKLIEWARKSGGLIFEDDYDSEYRYVHRPIPSLQGLDQGEHTIYVGSFSKVVYPSLSMGYLVVPRRMIDVVAKALSLWSRPPSTIDQMILADFIAEGHFARHLRRMRQIHHERRCALVTSVEKHLDDQLRIVGCDAGLHCAAILRKHTDDQDIANALAGVGVIAPPLSGYTVGGKIDSPGLVLGFASSSPAQIRAAVKRMASVLA